MARSRKTVKPMDMPPFDVEELFYPPEEAVMGEIVPKVVSTIGEVTKSQYESAVSLTRLIAEKDEGVVTQASILAVFDECMERIKKHSPLQELANELPFMNQ